MTTIATSNGKARAASMGTSSQSSSLSFRTGTPSARPTSVATPYKISMSTAKTAHARERPRGIPERAAVGRGLTPERVRSQSDRDSNVDDLEKYSARPHGTLQANHMTAAASRKPLTKGDVSAAPNPSPQPLTSADHAIPTATPQSAGLNDDSDSGSETYFQHRLRARRSKPRPQRGHRHPTPDEPSGKEASQVGPKSQDTSSAALSVPSI